MCPSLHTHKLFVVLLVHDKVHKNVLLENLINSECLEPKKLDLVLCNLKLSNF